MYLTKSCTTAWYFFRSETMAGSGHRRLVLPGFFSTDLCKELEFIHRSCGTVGYRPNVFSTTLSHLIATNCSYLILPFISVRERLKEKVEEFFGCEYELVIEFTGLISWCKGASIGWHSDDNRPYLKQRDFTVVCYLNNEGVDFRGGVLQFKDGEPRSVIPTAGDVVIYTADSSNIHSVEEVTGGERITLVLWFSRDSSHDEDSKLIARLYERLAYLQSCEVCMPLPASSNMYWHSQQELGFDIRSARLNALGYSLYYCDPEIYHSSSDSSDDPMERLIQICKGDQIYDMKFVNSMHALQVVQFYYWKAAELKAARRKIYADKSTELFSLQKTADKELVIKHDLRLAKDDLFDPAFLRDMHTPFDWFEFSLAVKAWKDYARKMHEILLASISCWQKHQSLFSCQALGENYASD